MNGFDRHEDSLGPRECLTIDGTVTMHQVGRSANRRPRCGNETRESMGNLTAGSFPLFRIAGIQVYLHWTWLLIAYFEIVNRANRYQSMAWNVIEYLALFGIVLLHEFGHALACRQVGGQANRIMLWPLGGVAFVQPPPRPGALLWSIAAGPLVNVILVPITFMAFMSASSAGLRNLYPDFMHFLLTIAVINFALLAFNMLPIYPLDG